MSLEASPASEETVHIPLAAARCRRKKSLYRHRAGMSSLSSALEVVDPDAAYAGCTRSQVPLRKGSDVADQTQEPPLWTPWRVAPKSGFEIHNRSGEVGLVQIDAVQFLVTEEFRFSDEGVLTALTDKLVGDGRNPDAARQAVDDARTVTPPRENPSDLASIPRFMRWFENSYGVHTLAAIIHDQLIVEQPNAGALGSDTLSDRFFREMLRSSGVPWLKRWIVWAAVALRTRWAAGGLRRVSVFLWLVLALAGITSFVYAVGSPLFGWPAPLDAWWFALVAVLLPFASAPLWGRQYGASLVAAAAAAWVLPAAVFALLGYFVYEVLESLARRAGLF
jgi:hypothetical protein